MRNTPINVWGKNKWPGMHQVWRTKIPTDKSQVCYRYGVCSLIGPQITF